MSNKNFKKPDAEAAETHAVQAPPAVVQMNSFALGMVERDNRWHLVEIPFDSETLTVGKPELVASDPSQMEAEEMFKVRAADKIFK